MLVHDIIKMNLVRQGYLPNYPYHLISDEEMFRAFLSVNVSDAGDVELSGAFADRYPCPNDSLEANYIILVSSITYHINLFLTSTDSSYTIPSWVYSYMLGEVICSESDKIDIHDMLVLMGIDNVQDILTSEFYSSCYEISAAWVNKLNLSDRLVTDTKSGKTVDLRPPTMFGEPHVLKALRIAQADVTK